MDIVSLVLWILNILSLLLIGRALISWVDPGYNWSISRALYSATEPILSPIRQLMPNTGMFDFSTVIAIVLIQVLSRLIVSSF
ncbi:MAG: YggT family protein [Thermomicrobiales bacterium]